MLDYITISARITILEALQIRNNKSFQYPYFETDLMYTRELRDMGIAQVSVWVDLNKIFYTPSTNYNCTYSSTIDAKRFFINGKYDFSNIIKTVEGYLPHSVERKLGWKLQSASFIYPFSGYYIKEYYQLLKSGFDLEYLNLKRDIEKIESESEEVCRIVFSSKGRKEKPDKEELGEEGEEIGKEDLKRPKQEGEKNKRSFRDSIRLEILLDYNQPKSIEAYGGTDIEYVEKKLRKNMLIIFMKVRKKKLIRLCMDYGIEDRNLYQFQEKIRDIDSDIFHSYMKRLAGAGSYHKFIDAEKIIEASDYTRVEKNKMCDVLKGVALYKGVSSYLNHVEDENTVFPCMNSIKKKAYAQEMLRKLQRIGINPVNLSVRKKITQHMLPNLMDVYEAKNPVNNRNI